MVEVFLPPRLYHAIPWFCLCVAIISSRVLPMTLMKWLCCGFLYSYSGLVLKWRFVC